MPSLKPFCSLELDLSFVVIGPASAGTRLDVPFAGTATSQHWDGERPVAGVDYVTVRSDGTMSLDIRATIGEGSDVIAYQASGVSKRGSAKGESIPQELLTFHTASEDFAYLNDSIAVAIGSANGAKLSLEVYLVEA